MRSFTIGFISAAIFFLTVVARAQPPSPAAVAFPGNVDASAPRVIDTAAPGSGDDSARKFYACMSARADLRFVAELAGGTLKGHLTLGRDGIFVLRYDWIEGAVAGSPPDEADPAATYPKRVSGPWSVEGGRVFLTGVAMGVPLKAAQTRTLSFELFSEKEDTAALGAGRFEVSFVKHAMGPDVCH